MTWYFTNAERNNCQLKILYPVEMPFKNEEEIKTFSDKGSLREFSGPIIK